MVVFIGSSPIPSKNWLSRFIHADPEFLARFAEEYRGARDDVARTAAALKFSLVLDDICINGTWKRTRPGRLFKADAVLAHQVKAQTDLQDITALDMGASDGTTTLDFAAALGKSTDGEVSVLMADLNLGLERFTNGTLIEYRTYSGDPVLLRLGKIGLRLPRSPRSFDMPSTLLARLYLSMHKLRAKLQPNGVISLASPMVEGDENIEAMEANIFDLPADWSDRFDVVRASNLLNLEYFSTDQLRHAIENLFGTLKDGALMLVSRNDILSAGEVENGTVWRKHNGAFVKLEDFGSGSEIATLVDDFRSSRTSGAG